MTLIIFYLRIFFDMCILQTTCVCFIDYFLFIYHFVCFIDYFLFMYLFVCFIKLLLHKKQCRALLIAVH